jgi:hypothetical protein
MNWILTDDKQPESEQKVLGYWPGYGFASLTYYAKDAPDSSESWIDAHGEDQDRPSHWIPDLEPPK